MKNNTLNNLFNRNSTVFTLFSLTALLISVITAGCGGGGGSSASPGGGAQYESSGTWSAYRRQAVQSVQHFAGTYSGRFEGDGQGEFIAVGCSDGRIFMFSQSPGLRQYGSGIVNSDGYISGESVGSDGYTGTFSGYISGDTASGSWTYGSGGGTWSAALIPARPGLQQFAGSYEGTFSGDDRGDGWVGIGSDGTLIGITNSANVGLGGVRTSMNSDGTIIEGLYEGFYTVGVFNGSVEGSYANGTWATNRR